LHFGGGGLLFGIHRLIFQRRPGSLMYMCFGLLTLMDVPEKP
jgi:hypothetical protein